MSGLGAWSFGFYHLNMVVPNTRVAHGITAFKNELIYNGNTGNGKIIPELPSWGKYVDMALRNFQKSHGLKVDGVLGPTTADALFLKRAKQVEDLNGIPSDYLARIKTHESNNDPVAQGYEDSADEGLSSICPISPISVRKRRGRLRLW